MTRLTFGFLWLVCLSAFCFSAQCQFIPAWETCIRDTNLKTTTQKTENFIALHPMLSFSETSPLGRVTPRPASNKTYIFLLALFLLFIYAILKGSFGRYYDNLLGIFTSVQGSKRQIKEQLENDKLASIFFNLLFFMGLGYLLFEFIGTHWGGKFFMTPMVYLYCFLASMSAVLLRSGLIYLLGWIFDSQKYAVQYLFSARLTNEFLGILLFPTCLLILVSSSYLHSSLIWISATLCLALFLLNYLRQFSLLRNLFRASFLHFLLYLCAFEILPVLLLIKWLR